MSRMSVLDIQGRELRYICYRRLEDSPHGIPDPWDPTSQQDTSALGQKTCDQVLLAEWDPIQERVQWGSPKMPGAKGRQGSSQGGPFR